MCVRCKDCMGHSSVRWCCRCCRVLMVSPYVKFHNTQNRRNSISVLLNAPTEAGEVQPRSGAAHLHVFVPQQTECSFSFENASTQCPVLVQLVAAAYFAVTHHQPSVCGIFPPSLCRCCDMASRPLWLPHFAHRPLILERRQVKLHPDCHPVQALNSSQCSQLETSLHPKLQLHTSQLPAFLLRLRDLWGLRGSSGCRCSGTWARRWGWSGGRRKGCLVLWSWHRKVPGQILQTEPPGQQHPGSAVERMKINHLKKQNKKQNHKEIKALKLSKLLFNSSFMEKYWQFVAFIFHLPSCVIKECCFHSFAQKFCTGQHL